MIWIKISGGLANQMFQFAFGEALRQQTGRDVQYDVSFYDDQQAFVNVGNALREFDLVKVFPAIRKQTSLFHNLQLRENFMARVGRKLGLLYNNGTLLGYAHEPGEALLNVNSLLRRYKNILLQGYWQHTSYWKYTDEFIALFRLAPDASTDERVVQLHEDITRGKSVCVHIRRGDYMKSTYFRQPALEYYLEAMAHVKEKAGDVRFYFFSDDPSWVAGNIEQFKRITNRVEIVSGRPGLDLASEFMLMQHCHHHIISNSTFSWWASRLTQAENPIRVSPRDWTVSSQKNQLIREGLLESFTLIENQ